MTAAILSAAPRPGYGHQAFRSQRRALMYVAADGTVRELTPADAAALIRYHGSVRRAAAAIGLPKSTLHDVAADVGKLREGRR